MTILFAFIGAVLNTGNDLVYRKSAIGKPAAAIVTFYFFASVVSAVIGGGGSLIVSGVLAHGWEELLFGLVLGLVSFGAYLFYLLSFGGGSASVTVTIFRLNMIPAIVLAYFILDEAISVQRGLAILLFVVGIILLAGGKDRVGTPTRSQVFFSITGCLLGGTATFLNKVAVTVGHSPIHLLFWRFTTVAALCAAYLWVRRSWQVRREHAGYAPLSGLFMCSSIFFIMEALRGGDVSLVMPITQLSFVIVTVLSWLFFGEKVTIRKTVGSIIAIAVVILIR